eukprot:3138471-Rhodomonas_salina.2
MQPLAPLLSLSQPRFPLRANLVEVQIKVHQRCAPPQHRGQLLRARITNAVEAQLELRQPRALPQHPRQRPGLIANVVAGQIKMSQRRATPKRLRQRP